MGDFEPFWEFVSGPLVGSQHFGEVQVDGLSGDLTVYLRDGSGASLWSKTLRPSR
ncbi:alkaline phosphatase D [Actinokineospora iranica]|uniref:Alkaline phosphatase D n=1 Tax=Actinokineospora iranica TaxID=1271860 RepID=A0A1G6VIB3_9PSEU|nr:alkaline phosphatase D [Actinokineospora iranica]